MINLLKLKYTFFETFALYSQINFSICVYMCLYEYIRVYNCLFTPSFNISSRQILINISNNI